MARRSDAIHRRVPRSFAFCRGCRWVSRSIRSGTRAAGLARGSVRSGARVVSFIHRSVRAGAWVFGFDSDTPWSVVCSPGFSADMRRSGGCWSGFVADAECSTARSFRPAICSVRFALSGKLEVPPLRCARWPACALRQAQGLAASVGMTAFFENGCAPVPKTEMRPAPRARLKIAFRSGTFVP